MRPILPPGFFVAAGALLLLGSGALPARAGSSPRPAVTADQVQAALQTVAPDERLKALAALTVPLTESDIPGALELAKTLPELRERVVFTEAVLGRWSVLAPAAAFAGVAALPESIVKLEAIRPAVAALAKVDPPGAAAAVLKMTPGKAQNEAIPIVAEVWAGRSVAEALAWVEQRPAGEIRERALHNVRFLWVHRDPVAALPHVLALPANEVRQALMMNIAEAWAARDPVAAVAWARGLSADDADGLILSAAIESWADRHPQAAAEYALGLGAEIRDRLALRALASWATQSPQVAMEWLLKQSDEPFQMRGAPEIMKVWAPADPAGAGAWVRKLPIGTLHDVGAHSYVDAVCEWEPALGIALATQLPDYPSRLMRVQQCLRFWREREPETARKWIDASDFDDAVKTDWRNGNLNAGVSVEAVKKLFKSQ